MRRHMTDEGWQIFDGLSMAGYKLFGKGLGHSETDVQKIVSQYDPAVVVMQDKREWDVIPGDFRDPDAKFQNVEVLKNMADVFRVTILKDAHQRPRYHMQSAEEIGCHAWITYYHSDLVKHLASYVRKEHLIRTYHTLDRHVVPQFNRHRADRALLSGAVSRFYPERVEMVKNLRSYRRVDWHRHPGYHVNGTNTPEFMKLLSNYKVAICTSSIYGYVLRKIIEATACGCVVITDLPHDEVLPEIDGNLIRMPRYDIKRRLAMRREYSDAVQAAVESYDHARQAHFAELAINEYCHIRQCHLLADNIDRLRRGYVH